MLIAICGTYTDVRYGSIRGNGKTLSATFLGYQAYKDGRKVYTNYYTTFSEMVTLNELLTLFKDGELDNVLVILDEAQVYLMNTGVKAKTLKEIINLFIAQTRKRNVDIIVTTQRYKNLHRQLRVQCDLVLIPLKYHLNESGRMSDLCTRDNCDKSHVVIIYNAITQEFLKSVLYPEEIGKLFNSDEIVFDEFIS